MSVIEQIPFHALKIRDLSFQVRLGCTEHERSTPQEVHVSIEFRFHKAPNGAQTDRLEQTICYAEVNKGLQKIFQHREYHLIEKIGIDAYVVAREVAKGNALISVKALKVRPPIANLLGGTEYLCGDFSP